jgi:hypothetical protein
MYEKGDFTMANENAKTRGGQQAAAPTELKQETSRAAEKRPLVPKDIDPHTIITVRNGFQGRLVYRSKKTGERFVWDSFGAEQDMEIGELRNARNSNKKYFINNWFMFDEPWIVDYIGMSQYYKFAIAISDFDKLFEKPVAEIERAVSKLSDGQKKSIAYRAKQLIANGGIDSNKTIATLEKCLGVELVEHDK